MIRISQLKLPVDHSAQDLQNRIKKLLRLSGQPFSYEIRRQSLDARRREEKHFVYTVDVNVKNEKEIFKKVSHNNIMLTSEKPYRFPEPGTEALRHPPVVIGSGPAGLFCAWYLARSGLRPVVLERGEKAEDRIRTVQSFWETGILDPESNVQFGEGGAGTFSDGKLNTLVKDPFGRNQQVLRRFVEAGAPEEILYQQKPHLGTDILVRIVTSLRNQTEEMGGSFRFLSKVTDLEAENGELKALIVNGTERLETETAVLAIGHSARDTFSMLNSKGIEMQPKAFAVGLRAEHPQKMLNMALYGEEENAILGAASYKLTHTCENGRGVYSFCMCPGGYVVNASSEPGRLAVNGMSYSDRGSRNGNAAIIVSVGPEDYPGTDALAGVRFQQELEKAFFDLEKGKIPVQRFDDFCAGKRTYLPGEVLPCIKGSWAYSNLREALPDFLSLSIMEGIRAFDRKLPGFARPDALLSGIESRTSSPVRIVRDADLCSSIKGVYPCGEGAGYAGGITSAAMDGIKIAEAIAGRFVLC